MLLLWQSRLANTAMFYMEGISVWSLPPVLFVPLDFRSIFSCLPPWWIRHCSAFLFVLCCSGVGSLCFQVIWKLFVFFAFFCLVTVLDAFPCIFMVLTSWSHPVWPRLLTLMWQCLYKAAFISHSQPLCVTEAESQTVWILIWLFTSWHI